MKKTRTPAQRDDPRDREIERLRTLVHELTERNALLTEALRRLQQSAAQEPERERSRL